jgi:hypothetical protein
LEYKYSGRKGKNVSKSLDVPPSLSSRACFLLNHT